MSYAVYENGEKRATISWDGNKITCDSPSYAGLYENSRIMGKTIRDGFEFFQVLPMAFRNGYITLELE